MGALKDESQFNRPAMGEGIPECRNSPRKSLEAQKCRTDPACSMALFGFVWLPQALRLDQPRGPHCEETQRSYSVVRTLSWQTGAREGRTCGSSHSREPGSVIRCLLK